MFELPNEKLNVPQVFFILSIPWLKSVFWILIYFFFLAFSPTFAGIWTKRGFFFLLYVLVTIWSWAHKHVRIMQTSVCPCLSASQPFQALWLCVCTHWSGFKEGRTFSGRHLTRSRTSFVETKQRRAHVRSRLKIAQVKQNKKHHMLFSMEV